MKEGVVYMAKTRTGNYIGQTRKQLGERIIWHKNDKRSAVGERLRAGEPVEWEILHRVSKSTDWELAAELNRCERYFIDKFNTYKRGLNRTASGQYEEECGKCGDKIPWENEKAEDEGDIRLQKVVRKNLSKARPEGRFLRGVYRFFVFCFWVFVLLLILALLSAFSAHAQ